MQTVREFFAKNRFPLGVAGVWLVVVWALVLAADAYVGRPLSLVAWAGDWDGGWYQSVVNNGYFAGVPTQQENLAFFPVYPLVTWLVSKIMQLPTVWAGMAVSSVSFAAALLVLYRFVAERWDTAVARWTLFLLAFGPFSFYFGMMYTEGLFLLLAAATLWYVYKKEWWWAALMAGLASGTRSVGVALGIMVVCAWVNEKWGGASQGSSPRGGGPAPHRVFSSARKLAAENSRYVSPHLVWLRQLLIVASLIIISFSGLLLFSLYLWQHTGDPIAYSHIQEFWPGRGGLSNITAELAYLWAHKTINLEYALTLMWYGATLVAFGGVALLIRMREYLMALYSGIAVSLPLVFGTATAMNRYMLVAVPIFIAYAVTLEQQRRWVKGIIVVACLAGLAGAIFLIVDPRAAFVG